MHSVKVQGMNALIAAGVAAFFSARIVLFPDDFSMLKEAGVTGREEDRSQSAVLLEDTAVEHTNPTSAAKPTVQQKTLRVVVKDDNL